MKAFLILEDGTVFEGTHIGAEKEVISEVVFTTGMIGYVEDLTNPAFVGKAVCMTYPLIGNYGVCKEDMESRKVWPDGIIVRELSRIPSNFRSECTIQEFLKEHGVTGIAGIDTRALTKILIDKGTMNGMITTNETFDQEAVLAAIKEHKTINGVDIVTCEQKYEISGIRSLDENGPLAGSACFDAASYLDGEREKFPSYIKELNGSGKRVAVLDLGVKNSALHSLAGRGCDLTVYPAAASAAEILADKPDGIFLSGGPGNPEAYPAIIAEIKKLAESGIPVFGVCLGHQMLALASGGSVKKMKYGHHGANYPVREVKTGQVMISSQSHEYEVDMAGETLAMAEAFYVNVNDGTNEGLIYTGRPMFTVQFHPSEAGSLFDQFINMMEGTKNA